MVVVWLVVGIALLLFELHHLAFYALFVAIGCFAGMATAVAAPSAIGLQAGVAIAVSILGVGTVRPLVSKAVHRRHTGYVPRGVHGGLVGVEAITLDTVGSAHDIGHVRLAGERWLAVSGSGTNIPPNASVVVTAVQGTTLVVWPADGIIANLEIEPSDGGSQ